MKEKFLYAASRHWLGEQPELFPAPGLSEPGVRGFFISSHRGCRAFAWLGLPAGASPRAPVPGVVLVHGGQGTAYAGWVRHWNKLGFAAIAVDTCGGMPTSGSPLSPPQGAWPRHEFSGAPGWGARDQGDLPPEEQWFTYAEAAVCHAHTVLGSQPEVDAGRIGITGISWGAVLALIAAAIDPRYRAVAAVYGCGFLLDGCSVVSASAFSPAARDWYANEWDPVNFLPEIAIPNLWLNGTNDPAFPLIAWERSTEQPSHPAQRCLKLRWPHSHGRWGEEPGELAAFFAENLNGAPPSPRITEAGIRDNRIHAAVNGDDGDLRGLLFVTVDRNHSWADKEWHSVGAACSRGEITALLPPGWVAAAPGLVAGNWCQSTGRVFFNSQL